MTSSAETLQRQLVALSRARPRDVGRHIRALEPLLQGFLRSQGLNSCGDVRLYGPVSMAPNSDLAGHAFLLEHQAAVVLRVELPGPDGRGGTVRWGDTPHDPAALERAWRQESFPAEPHDFAHTWSHGASGGVDPALAALRTVAAQLPTPLTAVYDAVASNRPLPSLTSAQLHAFHAAVRGVLAAVASPTVQDPPSSSPSRAWEPPAEPRGWQPPGHDGRAWQPPPPRKPDPPWQPPPGAACGPEHHLGSAAHAGRPCRVRPVESVERRGRRRGVHGRGAPSHGRSATAARSAAWSAGSTRPRGLIPSSVRRRTPTPRCRRTACPS
jgi:hypothetical protein